MSAMDNIRPAQNNDAVVTFYRAVAQAVKPEKADPSAGGTIPTRAFRYCEAIRSASSYGWYLYMPYSFRLLFDGADIFFAFDGDEEWTLLDSIQYPGFADEFNAQCPEDVRDSAPPWIARGAEPGIISLWTGLFAKTQPGWSLSIRSPVNIPRSQGFEVYEGIIETDHWFGPVFSNLRLIKTDVPIYFSFDMPIYQLQPIRQELYKNRSSLDFNFREDLGEMDATDWAAYHRTIVAPGRSHQRKQGAYAKRVRRKVPEPA